MGMVIDGSQGGCPRRSFHQGENGIHASAIASSVEAGGQNPTGDKAALVFTHAELDIDWKTCGKATPTAEKSLRSSLTNLPHHNQVGMGCRPGSSSLSRLRPC